MFALAVLRSFQEWLRDERARHLVRKRFPTLSLEANVQIKTPQGLILGRNVVIQRNTVLHCGGLEWCQESGGIEIGEGACISTGCILWGTGGKIIIGSNFDCGPGVKIFASRTRYEGAVDPDVRHVFSDVHIGDDVICFANSVISPGTTIGNGAVVAAGSVVVQDVEPYTLVGGVPAKPIRPRFKGDRQS